MISFESLMKSHFPLLLKWLESPHVKKWWDKDIIWNMSLINKKYATYVLGYKVLSLKNGQSVKKPIHLFLIMDNKVPIGYIQYYDKHDFPSHHGYDLNDIPSASAGVDIYIGEIDYIGKGIGVEALKLFMKDIIPKKFTNIFVDPEIDNISAIKAYEKAGFQKVAIKKAQGVLWMISSIHSPGNQL